MVPLMMVGDHQVEVGEEAEAEVVVEEEAEEVVVAEEAVEEDGSTVVT